MSELFADLTLLLCIAGMVCAHWIAWVRLKPQQRLPLMVFSGSYVITSAIGATIFGLLGIDYLESLECGLATNHLHEIKSVRYWLLVYLPLIVPPLIVALTGRSRQDESPQRPLFNTDLCLPLHYLVALIASVAYCIYCLKSGGFTISLSSWQILASEFDALITLRSEIMESASFTFFALVYVGLPSLSFVALYQIWRYRTLTWWILFLATAFATCWLGLATIQKSLLLVYLGSVAAGLLALRISSYKHLAVVAVLGIALLTLMQQFFMERWTFTESVSHITNRVAVTFPYYVNVYPDSLPYYGPDLGLWVFGIGVSPSDNTDVFRYMYPDITHVVGYATSPAHLRLFAQCGMPGAWVCVTLIGCGISLVTRLGARISGPLSYAIYVQLLVSIYYSTQVGLVDLVTSAYGIPGCVLTIAPLWLVVSQLGMLYRSPQQRLSVRMTGP